MSAEGITVEAPRVSFCSQPKNMSVTWLNGLPLNQISKQRWDVRLNHGVGVLKTDKSLVVVVDCALLYAITG
jgi:hypothetical protein